MKHVSVSVIITNYNKEKYLPECLHSVFAQSLSNLEVILVDDGSTDNSAHIIKEFQEKYPNLKVIRQSNRGVGSARNTGLLQATGEYITFLDADDYVSKDSYKSLYQLAKSREASIAVGNIRCFNDNKTWDLPYLKSVFDSRLPVLRNIETHRELNLSPSVGNKLFSRNLVTNHGVSFDEELYIGEDLLFTQACSYLSERIAVSSDITLNYRVNQDGGSLSTTPSLNFFKQLLQLQSKIKHLYASMQILDHIEAIETRQVRYFLKSTQLKAGLLNTQERVELLSIASTFFSLVSVERIRTSLSREELLLLEIFNKSSLHDLEKLLVFLPNYENSKELISEDNKFYDYRYNDFEEYRDVLEVKQLNVISKIEVVGLKDQTLYLGGYAFIEGLSAVGIKKSLIFRSKAETRTIPLQNDFRTDVTYLFSNNLINYNDSGFQTVEIKLMEVLGEGTWDLFLNIKQNLIEMEIPVKLLLAQLRNSVKPKIINKTCIIPGFVKNQLNITLKLSSFMDRLRFKASRILKDARYDTSFIKSKDYETFIAIALYKLIGRFLCRRQIWLIGERRDTAQDNSYHFYKYVRSNHPGHHTYYVIDKKAKDYLNIASFGNIIHYGSLRHTLYLLTCHLSINSYLESANFYTDSYKKIVKYYPEWQRNKKVFLQHGVIGVSRVNHTLHRNKTNYSLFVTSSKFEKNHVVKEFGFAEHEVADTGLARWDALQDATQGNGILLMPTWRNWIKSRAGLEDSRYFKTYLSFLKNPRLHEILMEKNLTLTFYPHYQIQKVLSKLPLLHERIKVVRQGEETVQQLLKRHALLITDYSTVSFDFAYMNKPVLFYQFDYEEFYSRHYNKGPIDHEQDLFGEVVKEEVELLKRLAAVNEWVKPEKMKNIDIYTVRSGHHCEQIYTAICNI